MIPTIKTEDTSSQTKTNEVPEESSGLIEEEVEETVMVKVIKRTRRSRSPSPRVEHHVFQNGQNEDDHHNVIINEIQDIVDSSNLQIEPKAKIDEGKVVITNKSNGEIETIQYSQQKSSTKNLDLNLQEPNASGMTTTTSRDGVKNIDEDATSTKASNCCFNCLSLCALIDDCFTCRGSGS